MHPILFRTRHKFTISITGNQKTTRTLDSPTEAGSLSFRLHHLAGNILPFCLRPVKGRKLFLLTGLVFAAHGAQRDGSGAAKRPPMRGHRPAAGMPTKIASRPDLVGASKNRFQTEHRLNFLHQQGLEEVDEAHNEFECAS